MDVAAYGSCVEQIGNYAFDRLVDEVPAWENS